jgi:hypothetical protein
MCKFIALTVLAVNKYITRKTPAEILKIEAYLLFYQKKSLAKEEERQRILQCIEKEVGLKFHYIDLDIIDALTYTTYTGII